MRKATSLFTAPAFRTGRARIEGIGFPPNAPKSLVDVPVEGLGRGMRPHPSQGRRTLAGAHIIRRFRDGEAKQPSPTEPAVADCTKAV